MSKVLTADGYDFSYIESGDGAPLIFIHGSLLDYRYWEREVAHFSSSFRAIAMSRRYHWPNPALGSFSYTGAEQTTDVIAFIEQLKAGPVHLVGHSYGGYIGGLIACLRPELLLSLTLIEPGGPIEGEVVVRSRMSDLMLGVKLVEQGEAAKGVAHFLDTVCYEPKWQDGSDSYKNMTLDNAWTITQQVLETRATLKADDLRKFSYPVLLMIGERSRSPFPETLDRLQELLPNVSRVSIPEASHMVNVDNHPRFISELEKFLSSVA